jgi:hypothetical protein
MSDKIKIYDSIKPNIIQIADFPDKEGEEKTGKLCFININTITGISIQYGKTEIDPLWDPLKNSSWDTKYIWKPSKEPIFRISTTIYTDIYLTLDEYNKYLRKYIPCNYDNISNK